MYRSEKTTGEEFPQIPREILNKSLEFVTEDFPDRVVSWRRPFCVPAYSWDSAGSAKGGSAEHISYEKVIFLPAENDEVIVASVGNREGGLTGGICIMYHGGDIRFPVAQGYSILLMDKITSDLAGRLIEFYHENVKGREAEELDHDYRFPIAMEKLLGDGTREFDSAVLFAFDPEIPIMRDGFYLKGRWARRVNDFKRDLERIRSSAWHLELTGSVRDRERLARFIADYVKGDGNPDLMLSKLDSERRYLSVPPFGFPGIVKTLDREKS